jgi:F-type H+-transporting ATPase subunit epsilon
MAEIRLKIISQKGPYLSIAASSISVVLKNAGQITVLPNHTPLIGIIDISELNVIAGGKERFFAISGGVLEIKNHSEVVILANAIEAIDEIDYERANAARLRAQKLLEEGNDNDIKRAEASLSRALNRLKVLSRNDPSTKR